MLREDQRQEKGCLLYSLLPEGTELLLGFLGSRISRKGNRRGGQRGEGLHCSCRSRRWGRGGGAAAIAFGRGGGGPTWIVRVSEPTELFPKAANAARGAIRIKTLKCVNVALMFLSHASHTPGSEC